MNKDAVQHERGPRNSTLRRQMALFINKDCISSDDVKSLQQEIALRSLPMHPNIPSYILDLSSRNRGIIEPSATYSPPILSPFHPIPPSPTDATVESVCETAAQLLFMNIRWMKAQTISTQLPIGDQLALLEHSWTDLFILGAAQYLLHFNFNPLLCVYRIIDDGNNSNEKNSLILNEANRFQNILYKLAQMGIDNREYSCLRSILLYNIVAQQNEQIEQQNGCSKSTKGGLEDMHRIAALRNEAISELLAHINLTKPTQPLRFKNLMVLLEQFKDVSSFTIEELFFRRTIGEVTIVKVMADMYSQGKI